eukprot:6555832-Pyramimonas_sp.AAC.1
MLFHLASQERVWGLSWRVEGCQRWSEKPVRGLARPARPLAGRGPWRHPGRCGASKGFLGRASRAS